MRKRKNIQEKKKEEGEGKQAAIKFNQPNGTYPIFTRQANFPFKLRKHEKKS